MGRKPVNDEIRAQVKALWESGHSAGMIAKKLGRTKNSVIGLIFRMKLGPRPTDRAQPGYHWPGRNKPAPTKPKPKVTLKAVTSLTDEPPAIGPINTFGDGCKWIAGDITSGDWRCCDHEIEAYSLCAFHRPIGRVKPPARAR